MPRTNSATHAAELHAQAVVIDAHSDILMALADGKMRLGDRVDVPDVASWEPPFGVAELARANGWPAHSYYFSSMGQYDIPRLLEGGVTLQVCAMYLRDAELDRALQRGLDMTWCLHREARENPQFDVVTTVKEIRRAKAEGKVAGLLAFEGLEPLGYELRYLDLWYEMGLRMASLTHNRRNAFGDGWQPGVHPGGLTDLGKRAVKRMNELGIVVDLGHMNQAGFWDVMEIATGPVIVSHTSPMGLFPQRPEDSNWWPVRDVSRGQERLDRICRTGGVVGAIGFEGGLDRIVAEIEYLLEHAGPDHVGIGTDFCGFDTCTPDFCRISHLPRVTERLVERGHSDEVILKILGANLLRVFEQVWKA